MTIDIGKLPVRVLDPHVVGEGPAAPARLFGLPEVATVGPRLEEVDIGRRLPGSCR